VPSCDHHRLWRVREVCDGCPRAGAKVARSRAGRGAGVLRVRRFGTAGSRHPGVPGRYRDSGHRQGLLAAEAPEVFVRDAAGGDFKDNWPAFQCGRNRAKSSLPNSIRNGPLGPKHFHHTRTCRSGEYHLATITNRSVRFCVKGYKVLGSQNI